MTAVPTLSAKGWIDDIENKADRLTAYFFVSEFSQSELYAGNVASLPYIVANYGHDQLRCATQVEDALRTMFQRYYDQVSVTVTTDTINGRDNGQYNLIVDLNVVQGAYRYSLGKLISTANNLVTNIMDINNGVK